MDDPKLKQKVEEIGQAAMKEALKGLTGALDQVKAIMKRLWDMNWYHKLGALIVVLLIVAGGLVAAGYSLTTIMSSLAASVCSVAQIAWAQLQKILLTIAASERTLPLILTSFGIASTGFSSQLAGVVSQIKSV